jgi:hypothetical protein
MGTHSTPPLWSSGQSSWLQVQRSRVRFPTQLHFLRRSGSGTGSTQPREYNWAATWKVASLGSRKPRLTAVGDPLRWPRDIFYPQKLALTSPTSGGRSVSIVRFRTKATEFSVSTPRPSTLHNTAPTTTISCHIYPHFRLCTIKWPDRNTYIVCSWSQRIVPVKNCV